MSSPLNHDDDDFRALLEELEEQQEKDVPVEAFYLALKNALVQLEHHAANQI